MSILLSLAIAASGLHGIVTRGPTRPVCQVGVPCSEPAVGARLAFSRAGTLVATVHVGTGGRYAIRLRPGLYTVRVTPATRIGGVKPQQVLVRRGVDARINFAIDTGIR
jgi:hypothetical protein